MKLFCTSSGPLDVLEVLQQQQYPVRQLTKREQSLFKAPKPALRKVDDHGFIYRIKPEMMKDAPEPVVRALSTRTAALPQLRAFRRSQLLSKFGNHEFDSGSSRVQSTYLIECPFGSMVIVILAALMTERIQSLSSHLQRHRKDHDARRQMAILISRRQRLLRYMIRNDYDNYRCVHCVQLCHFVD